MLQGRRKDVSGRRGAGDIDCPGGPGGWSSLKFVMSYICSDSTLMSECFQQAMAEITWPLAPITGTGSSGGNGKTTPPRVVMLKDPTVLRSRHVKVDTHQAN